MKPKIAIFSLTGCEGCSLAILELENELLDILEAVEIVNFREGMTEKSWDIDIGFVDGAVSTPTDAEEVKHMREHSKVLVAIGSCACLGGINTLKNHQDPAEYRKYVYGERAEWFDNIDAQPISNFVKVDYDLPGCPMVKEEFLQFVKLTLAGRPFRLPQTAVCVECKKRGNLCLYEQGIICLGPVTRAGCDAICPSYGSKCEGCRGLVGEEQLKAAGVNLREQYDVKLDDVLADFRMFGAYQGKDLP
nr:NADH:ubiquinone oxidoreductase [Planctomycetota bacterium]